MQRVSLRLYEENEDEQIKNKMKRLTLISIGEVWRREIVKETLCVRERERGRESSRETHLYFQYFLEILRSIK